MRLKYLYIKDYKKFHEIEIKFESEFGNTNLYKKYYPNLNFNILVGENGVGKTTIMSFISRVFNNLQRYHEKIESDFVLKYDILHEDTNEEIAVTIKKEEMNIYFMAEGYIEDSLLLEWSPYRKNSKPKAYQLIHTNITNFTTYNEIRCFLPKNIITSVFSIHGEYPESRNDNYLGDKILEVYKISDVYGSNHYKIKSISKGIVKFIRLCKNNSSVQDLLEILNLRYTFKAKVHLNCTEYFLNEFSFEPWREFINSLGYSAWEEFYFIFVSEYHQDKCMMFWKWASDPDCEEYIYEAEYDILNSSYIIDMNKLFELEEKYKIEIINKLLDYQLAHFNDMFFIKQNSYETSLYTMSSGEKMFFIRILSILTSIENNSLIIIEEPELHLNPSWTKQIISMIELLFGEYKANFLIATHSYSFINNLFTENILLLTEDTIQNPNIKTLLANEREISNNFFKNSRCYNYIEKKVVNNLENASIEELEDMLSYLGESYYAFLVYKQIQKVKGVQ